MDLFYDLVKKSNNDQLELINKEIYKMNRNNQEYWNFIIQNTKINDEMILDNLKNINIDLLLKRQKLGKTILINEDFLDSIIENNFLNEVLKDQILSKEVLEIYIEKFEHIDWDLICKYQNIEINFMEKYFDKLNWDLVCENQFLTLEFISKYMDNINWSLLSQNIKLEYLFNESFLEIFSEKNIWDILIWSNNISSECIIKNLDKLSHKKILDLLEFKNLEIKVIQEVILKFNDKSIYDTIIKNQSLSLEFINKHFDKFELNDIIENQPISIEFLKLFQKDIDLKKLSYNDNLNENLLLDIYDIKDKFNSSLDWDYISEYGFLTKKSIKVIKELNKELLLENININLN